MSLLGRSRWPRETGSSRISVANVVPLDKSADAPFAGVNVYYENVGSIPVACAIHRTVLVIPPAPLTPDQTEAYLRAAESVPFQCVEGNEIQPNAPKNFFSSPDRPGPEADNLTNHFADIVAGRTGLYVVVVFKYKDRNLPDNKIRVTEFCGYFTGTVEIWHNCGRNRVHEEELRSN